MSQKSPNCAQQQFTFVTPASLKSDLSNDMSSDPDISCSKKAWQYIGNPMASSHWLTSLGDHCKAISIRHDDDVWADFGANFELLILEADDVDAEPNSDEVPRVLDAAKEDNVMEGDLPNLGTRNQEFLRPDS